MLTVCNVHMGEPARLYSRQTLGAFPDVARLRAADQWGAGVCIGGSSHNTALGQWRRLPGYRDLQSV